MVGDLGRLLCFREIRSFLLKVRSLVVIHSRTDSCGVASKCLFSDTLPLRPLYQPSYGGGEVTLEDL